MIEPRIIWEVRSKSYPGQLVSFNNIVVEASEKLKWAIGQNMNHVNNQFRYYGKNGIIVLIGMEKAS